MAGFCSADLLRETSPAGSMQAEATDTSLKEGIEVLNMKDSEEAADGKEDEDSTKQPDTEMAEEDDATAKEDTGTVHA